MAQQTKQYTRQVDSLSIPTNQLVDCTQDVFQSAGVTAPITIIPEPVDVDFLSLDGVDPLPLPAGQLVFGQPVARGQPHTKLLSVRSPFISALLSVPRCQVPFCPFYHVCSPVVVCWRS